jgi:hypothetical protein
MGIAHYGPVRPTTITNSNTYSLILICVISNIGRMLHLRPHSSSASHHCLSRCTLESASRATPLTGKHVLHPQRLPDRQARHGSMHLQPPRFFGQRARDHASHYSVMVAPGASCRRVSLTGECARRDLLCPGSKQNQGIWSTSRDGCRVGDLTIHIKPKIRHLVTNRKKMEMRNDVIRSRISTTYV